jgi:Undecaprenyl-phosphate glucose phosphotransferase
LSSDRDPLPTDAQPGIGLVPDRRRPEGTPQRRASSIRWTHGLINRGVICGDIILSLASTGVGWLASPEPPPLTWLQALAVALIMTVVFVRTNLWMGAYRVERYTTLRTQIVDLMVYSLPAIAAGLIILLAFVPDAWERRDWFWMWYAISFGTLVVARQVERIVLRIALRRGLLRRRVVVVGSGPMSEAIVSRIRALDAMHEYQLVGVFDEHLTRGWRSGEAVPAELADRPDLAKYAQNFAVDLVVIALPWNRPAKIFALVRSLQWIAADVVVPFEASGLRPQFVPPMTFINSPVLQVMRRPLKGTQGLLKLAEDYVVGTLGLLVVSPILLAAAIAIRLEGRGPILFCQPRVGFNGKPFLIYKLRTMTVDPTDDGSKGTQRHDQRITRVGTFLRRTSIDELPQLLNVLRGEMSIVGPRPHVSNMLVGEGVYSEVVRQYAARHRIKPGITGWAQINGMRGGINTVAKATEGADLDLYYVANWSLRLDIRIMIQTLMKGLVGRSVF